MVTSPKSADGHTLELVLYVRAGCLFCDRVLRRASELEVGLLCRDISLDEDARATLQRVGGRTQVPCLFIDGEPLYESADIIAFLERHVAGLATPQS